MIIVFRNFFRNKMVNLSATSIRHFMPDAKIYCLSLYKANYSEEYSTQEPLLSYIEEFTSKTKYVGTNPVQDHPDSTKTNGYGNPDNAKYFSEGYNIVYDKFRSLDEKVLILSEDHFFTNGKTLQELLDNDWHVAFATGFSGILNANASILGINPTKLRAIFPMDENYKGTIENSIAAQILFKKKTNTYCIQNRKWIDYCGDGIYTNSSADMERELKKVNII